LANVDLDALAAQYAEEHRRRAKPAPDTVDIDALAQQYAAGYQQAGGRLSRPKAAAPAAAPGPTGSIPKGALSILQPGVVNIGELSDEGRSGLFMLDNVLRSRGIKAGTLTSGRRKPDGTRSHHHEGNAIDFVAPGDMAKLAKELQALGFRAQFEKAGQRNPNGSVASGDHIHVTLLGGPKGKSKPTNDLDGLASRLAAEYHRGRGTSGKATVAGLMADLTKPTTPSPFVPTDTEVQAAADKVKASPKVKSRNPLATVTYLSNSYNQWLNQMAKEGGRIPSVTQDPAAHFAAMPAALQRAFTEARQSFGPDAVEPQHFRTMFGAEKGKTGRAAYNTLAVLDYVSSAVTDPTGLVVGPAMKGVKVLASPVTRRLGTAVEGGKAQAALMKAQHLREQAETAFQAAKTNATAPAGRETLKKLGKKVGQARAAEQAALQAVEGMAQTSRAAKLGVGAAKTAPAKVAIKTEQAAAAHLRQEATKLTEGWLKLVGLQKGFWLSRPSTIASNTVGNVAAAESELTRHGIPLAKLALHGKGAKAEVDAFRAGNLVGDAAELETHAPGVLGTLVQQTMGAKKSANPLLEAQSYVDQMMKVSVYKALKAKLGPEAAAQRVKTALFDYSDRPALLQLADKYGVWVFSGFPVAATKSFVDTLVTRPDLIARYPRLQEQLMREFPGSSEAYDKLPPYQRGPFTFPVGKDTFVDLSRLHPYGMALGMLEAGKRGVTQGLAPSPPDSREISEQGVIGPTTRALRKASSGTKSGAPGSEQVWDYIREEVMGRVPAVKDIARLRDAWIGAGTSDWKTAEPQSKAAATAQALLGISTVKGETEPEKMTRQDAKINARGKTADTIAAKVEAGLKAGTIKNRFKEEAEAIQSFDDARREFKAADRYLNSMILSPKNIDAKGKPLPGGFNRIRDAVLRLKALEDRLNVLGEGQP